MYSTLEVYIAKKQLNDMKQVDKTVLERYISQENERKQQKKKKENQHNKNNHSIEHHKPPPFPPKNPSKTNSNYQHKKKPLR